MRLPDSMFLLKEHPNTTQRRDGKLQPGDVKITMTIGARPLLEGELGRPISNPPLLTHRGLYSDMAETGPEAADLFSALGCSIRRACMARDRGPAPATAPLPPPHLTECLLPRRLALCGTALCGTLGCPQHVAHNLVQNQFQKHNHESDRRGFPA